MKPLWQDAQELAAYSTRYTRKKVIETAHRFEGFKNLSVDVLMHKRGILQKRIWHGSMIGLSAFGLVTSGLFGGQTIVSSSFPGVGGQDPRFSQSSVFLAQQPTIDSLSDTHTTISEKPRAEIIEYEVKSGDTVSTIAERHGISADTIRWANDLTGDTIKPGDKLKILPVSGVAVTVKSGDTLESLATKYSTSAEAILQYPFNDIPDDLKLSAGQTLVLPDGAPPAAPVKPRASQPQFAQGQVPSSKSFSAPAGGNFMWPTTFQQLSTYFSWWHPGVDLANRAAPPIAAADGGTVVVAGWPDNYGYGNRVVIDHGNGYKTLYAHLSNIYVSVGQRVSRGQSIGQMGNTGRSTGTHLHFEMHYKGIAVNPLSILK